ncbi:MAG: pyridoxamine 5'-phosphate oxidase family protein, partial [Dysosmobacter welbionis]
MRPMRRKDRAVTDPAKIRAVLAECQVCRLGLRDGDRVYVVPLNFGLAEREGKQFLYFHGAKEGRKADLIRQGGCACFEMDTGYRLQG